MERYEFSLAPTPAHLQAIGMVVVESAVLDNVLELAIWFVEGLTPELGFSETLHLGFRKKAMRFVKAAKKRFVSIQDRQALTELAKDLRIAGRQRALIVHGSWAWGIKPDEPWVAKYRQRKGRVFGETRRMKPRDIELIANNISRACMNLIHFLQVHGAEPPPFGRKQRPTP